MKAIVCEMCGSQDFAKQDGMYVCQHCKTKYDPEEAKKLMVEVSGFVEIDNSKKLENLYVLARRAKEENNSEDAANYYSQIALEDPNSWEAQFYKTYFTCLQTKIAYMRDSCTKLENCLENVFSLIDSNVKDTIEKKSAFLEVYSSCFHFSQLIIRNTLEHATEMLKDGLKFHDYSARERSDQFQFKNLRGVFLLIYKLGMVCKSVDHNGPELKLMALKSFKYCLSDTLSPCAVGNEKEIVIKQIKAIDPDFQEPQKPVPKKQTSSGGCYVATCVYGSYDCPEVWTLRRFRDFRLAKTRRGRAFIRLYYRISPGLVKRFGHTRWFRRLWKGRLDRMVEKLRKEGFDSTPYYDR